MAENNIRVKRYSKAVFELSLEQKNMDEWLEDLHKMAAMASISEISEVMSNPKFTFENKSRLLTNYLKGISQKALNLAFVLIKKDNFNLIKDIYADYQVLMNQYQGVAQAEVTTAMPIDENQKTKIAIGLASITGKKIIVTNKVDSKIIGGMVARVDGKIIDGSTRSQLAALKNGIINAGIEK